MNDTIVTRLRRNDTADRGDEYETCNWLSIHCVCSARRLARSYRLAKFITSSLYHGVE